jgi:hypothetical protein
MRPSATSGLYRNLCVILAAKPAELLVVASMKFELVIIFEDGDADRRDDCAGGARAGE